MFVPLYSLWFLLFFFLLILGGRGSYVAAIQRRILFTTALYFCTDELCTQSHQFSPFLSVSFVLSLHISLIYRDLTCYSRLI